MEYIQARHKVSGRIVTVCEISTGAVLWYIVPVDETKVEALNGYEFHEQYSIVY